MTRADWLALAGYVFLIAGLSSFFPKHWISIAVFCTGIVCIRLARAASPRRSLDLSRRRQRPEAEME